MKFSVKELGKEISSDDWEATKIDRMYRIVSVRAEQSTRFRHHLLATEGKRLLHSVDDAEWGIGSGAGMNALGHLFEKIRDSLRLRFPEEVADQFSSLSAPSLDSLADISLGALQLPDTQEVGIEAEKGSTVSETSLSSQTVVLKIAKALPLRQKISSVKSFFKGIIKAETGEVGNGTPLKNGQNEPESDTWGEKLACLESSVVTLTDDTSKVDHQQSLLEEKTTSISKTLNEAVRQIKD